MAKKRSFSDLRSDVSVLMLVVAGIVYFGVLFGCLLAAFFPGTGILLGNLSGNKEIVNNLVSKAGFVFKTGIIIGVVGLSVFAAATWKKWFPK